MFLTDAIAIGMNEGWELDKAFQLANGSVTPWNDQPWGYTMLQAWLLQMFGFHVGLLRCLGLALAVGGALAARALCLSRWSSCLLFLGLLFCQPNVFDQLSSAMLEPAGCFAALIALGLGKWGFQAGGRLRLIGAGFAAATAMHFKLTSIIILAPMAAAALVMGLFSLARRGNRDGSSMGAGKAGVFGLYALAGLLAGNLLFVTLSPYYDTEMLWGSHMQAKQHILDGGLSGFSIRPDSVPKLTVFLLCLSPLLILTNTRDKPLVLTYLWGLPIFALLVHLRHAPWWSYYSLHFAIPAALAACVLWDALLLPGISALAARRRPFALALASAPLLAMASLLAGEARVNWAALAAAPRRQDNAILAAAAPLPPGSTLMAYNRGLAFHLSGFVPPEISLLPAKRFWAGDITKALVDNFVMAHPTDYVLDHGEAWASNPRWRHGLGSIYEMVAEDGRSKLYKLRENFSAQAGKWDSRASLADFQSTSKGREGVVAQ